MAVVAAMAGARGDRVRATVHCVATPSNAPCSGRAVLRVHRPASAPRCAGQGSVITAVSYSDVRAGDALVVRGTVRHAARCLVRRFCRITAQADVRPDLAARSAADVAQPLVVIRVRSRGCSG